MNLDHPIVGEESVGTSFSMPQRVLIMLRHIVMTQEFALFFYLGTLNGREPTTNEVTKYLNFHDHSKIHDKHYLFVDSGVNMFLKDR